MDRSHGCVAFSVASSLRPYRSSRDLTSMNAPQPRQRLAIAEQAHDTRMLLQRRRDEDKKLSACSEAGQTGLEVLSNRFELQPRQEAVVERRLAKGAQERAPVIVRAERVVGHGIIVVVPPIGQFSVESRHRLVSPHPVAL